MIALHLDVWSVGISVFNSVYFIMTSNIGPTSLYQAMLLCNLTASEEGCRELLQLGQDKLEGLNM